MDERTFDRPVILVTGASRGIGAATARLAGARGYAVAVNYCSNSDAAAKVVADIRDGGGEAVAIRADVGAPEAVEALFAQVDERFGRLDALVNNAGITLGRTAFLDIPPEDFRRVIGVNLIGTIHCLRAAAARMALSRGGFGGAIVNVSSEAGRFGGNRISAYAASKGAVNALTVGLARELVADGIRLNAVSPSVIDTEPNFEPDPAKRQALEAGLPMGRMGRPYEVAPRPSCGCSLGRPATWSARWFRYPAGGNF
ncbi:MAG: 3-oxoacyl-ACP reductase [Rhodospirillaceae bacterium]|nr:MAG: 3-oxoacyl-ACP reductase [Rhodospirillaceae bacterium]